MATFESIKRLGLISAALRDQTAAEICDGTHRMTQKTIEQVKKALAEMSELEEQFYRLKPQMRGSPSQPYECSVADRLLVESMSKAAELEHAGNCEGAIETLKRFLKLDSSPWHQEMAIEELERLQGSASA